MDGDRYHRALKMRYQQLYKQVSQGHFAPQELAHNALRPLMKDVKGYGDGVIALIGQAGDEIERRMGLPVLRGLEDRDALKLELEQRAQAVHADPRGKGLALEACERYIDDLDHSTEATNVRQNLIAGYLMSVYTANFESPATTTLAAAKQGISHNVVVAQLSQVREHVEAYTSHIAGSIAKKLTLDRVRMLEAPRANEVVELDEVLSL